MQIHKATDSFEEWLGKQIRLVPADVEFKHHQMRTSAFAFFRATFYRWLQVFDKLDALITKAPAPLAVGDLHVENFGTWIDAEGRLIWGVNDFDEAIWLPYTNDLIRLACSVELAIRDGELKIGLPEACEAILDGYASNLEADGAPFVLAEKNVWLREAATGVLREPVEFWKRMDSLPGGPDLPDVGAVTAVEQGLPSLGLAYGLRTRRAGLGSLGRIRYVALANWRGGRIAREVKAMAPSADNWARGAKGPYEILVPAIAESAVRCVDPCLSFQGAWQVRRLAPYCTRIELSMLSKERDEARLVEAMGWELANVHRGTPQVLGDLVKHLANLPKKWLKKSASAMADLVEEDFEDYRSH